MGKKNKDKRRRWPTTEDLLAWYICSQFDDGAEVDPKSVKCSLRHFRKSAPIQVHQDLYNAYLGFRDKFLPPGDVIQVGTDEEERGDRVVLTEEELAIERGCR